MYRAVLTLAWLVGTIYATIPLFWLIIHPCAERLRARRSQHHIIIPAWFGMMAVVYFMTWPWREAVLYHAPATWLAAVFPERGPRRAHRRSRWREREKRFQLQRAVAD